MSTTDLQESIQNSGKDYFDITIKKCLWHTACVENGCEKLCRLFFDVDDVTYGGLKKQALHEQKLWGMVEIVVIFIFIKNKTKRKA